MDVSTVAPKAADRSITVDYPFPDTLQGCVEAFGEEVVKSTFLAEAVIKLQAKVRSMLEAGAVANKKGEIKSEHMNDDEIKSAALSWKPGVAIIRKSDPVATFLGKVEKMAVMQNLHPQLHKKHPVQIFHYHTLKL